MPQNFKTEMLVLEPVLVHWAKLLVPVGRTRVLKVMHNLLSRCHSTEKR